MNEKLYQRCRRKGLVPHHVAEVGVYLPKTSNILGFINDGVRATLVEADPLCISAIHDYFRGKENVTTHECAVYDREGEVELYRTNASTFIGELAASPALINDNYQRSEADRFVAQARLFSDIDDGTIDILSIDVEGAEWYVIKNLRSHPHVISVETHGRSYRNPHLREILAWFQEQGYVVWYRDKSDTVFVDPSIVTLNWFERRFASR